MKYSIIALVALLFWASAHADDSDSSEGNSGSSDDDDATTTTTTTTKKPCACQLINEPVCASNGVKYANKCAMNCTDPTLTVTCFCKPTLSLLPPNGITP